MGVLRAYPSCVNGLKILFQECTARAPNRRRYTQANVTTLEELTLIRAPLERCFDLARSVEVHVLGNVHFGEEAIAQDGKTNGLLGLGDRVTWRARHFGVRQCLTSEITRFDPPHAFQDTMLSGAFAFMQHDHFFLQHADGATAMRDIFRFAAPLPLLGLLAERLVLDRYMRNLLRERNAVIKQVAESGRWRSYVK
jgi:ligand-binding SRPBCC domain-containing protein